MDFIFQFSFRLKCTTFFLRASLHGYILLKTNSYFSILQTKYETKITSLRGIKKRLKRISPTSAVKLPDFSAELWQLLTRSFGARRVEGFHPCSPLAKMDASFGARGRVVFCLCLPCGGQNTVINREFFTFCLVVSTFFVTLCRSSQPIVAGRAMKNFMESRLSPPISPSMTVRVKRAFLLGGGR